MNRSISKWSVPLLSTVLLMLLAGCTVITLPGTPPAVDGGALLSLALAPTEGGANTAVQVQGTGWPAGQPIGVYLEDLQTGQRSAQAYALAQVGQDGRFMASFSFPNDPRWTAPPQVLITARSVDTGEQASVVFRLLGAAETATPFASGPVAPTATPLPAGVTGSARVTAFALNVRLGPSTQYSIVTTASQGDQLALIGQDASGSWLLARLEDGTEGWVARSYTDFTGILPITTATPQPTVSAGAAFAWQGEYFPNGDLSGAPSLVRNDPRVSFNWGTGAPAANLPADNFSVRWTRSLNFPAGTYRFSVRSDDGVRVWLDGDLVIDQWREAAGETYTAERQLNPGQHSLRIEYFERLDRAQVHFWWERPGNFAQWRGEYYATIDLSGTPVVVRNDASVDFNWGAGSPGSRVPADRFSVRWTRTLAFEDAIYRFRAVADDGLRLYVDGNLVIDAWQEGLKPELTADLRLPAGPHSLRLEYYENGGNALARLGWERLTAYPDWLAEYWNNPSLQGSPSLVRNDAGIDFNWGTGAPAPGLPNDGFSARWSRTLNFDAGSYRFHLLVDDGARLWVDDQLLIDAWQDGGARELTAEVALAQGSHSLRLAYYEGSGTARVQLWWEQVLAPVITDWKGEYYANRTLSGSPSLVRNDRSIDFNWGGGSPAPGLPADQFSVRWSRTINFPAGVYRLVALSDDGMRVLMDGNLVLDAWFDQGNGEVRSVDLALSGNRRLVVEYYENSGGARAIFQWSRVGDLPTTTPTPTPTVQPATPTPTPTPTVQPATPTPTPTPTQVAPARGTVSGSLCWPPGATATTATVYFQLVAGGAPLIIQVAQDEPTYQISLLPGQYQVFAWLDDGSIGALYPDTLTVSAGGTVSNVDLCEWGSPGVPPPPAGS